MPCRNLNLKARADRTLIRSTSRSTRFVLADIQAPHAHLDEGRKRAPVNLAFVLDRSGSMAGEKIRLAKAAIERSISRLQPEDRFSVVAYDDRIEVAVGSIEATAENRRAALVQLSMIGARDGTNLGEGWLRGCEQVAAFMSDSGVNRTLLLTDGLANIGITDSDTLAGHAAALRARGVSTTTFGVGTNFNEVLLQAMATAGGGNYYYIAEAAQIEDIITSEVGEALDVVARDVTLEIDAPEGVKVDTLSPFALMSSDGRASLAIGSLIAEQVAQVVLRITFPLGETARETGVVLSLTDRSGVADGASVGASWQYGDNKANDIQPRDVEVDRAVAVAFASIARQEATALNRRGAFHEANAALAGVAKRIRTYAGRDSEMRAIVSDLERDALALAAPMAEASLKEMHFLSFTSAKMRARDGKAIRRPDVKGR